MISPISFSVKVHTKKLSNNPKRTSFMNMLLSGGLDELIELLISGMMVFIFTALSFIKL